MEGALEEKKKRLIKRLENTIESSNCILYAINEELESMLEDNRALEKTAEIYESWRKK